MRPHPLVQLSKVKLLEFVREPEAIFWVLIFPVLLSLALGIAFRSKAPGPLAIGVADGPGAAEAALALKADPALRPRCFSSTRRERVCERERSRSSSSRATSSPTGTTRRATKAASRGSRPTRRFQRRPGAPTRAASP